MGQRCGCLAPPAATAVEAEVAVVGWKLSWTAIRRPARGVTASPNLGIEVVVDERGRVAGMEAGTWPLRIGELLEDPAGFPR